MYFVKFVVTEVAKLTLNCTTASWRQTLCTIHDSDFITMNNAEDIFKIVVSQFAEKISERKCDDQSVCDITINSGNVTIPPKNNWTRKMAIPNDKQKIVIIMESPHSEEFKGTTPAPANGKTGDNIGMHFPKVVKEINSNPSNHIDDGKYELILMNAIQNQCSMGISTKYFRDISFIGLWFKGGEADFKKRFKALKLGKNDVVINSCTLGDTSTFKKLYGESFSQENIRKFLDNSSIQYKVKDGLRKLVDNAIQQIKPKSSPFSLFKTNHPSNWDNKVVLR